MPPKPATRKSATRTQPSRSAPPAAGPSELPNVSSPEPDQMFSTPAAPLSEDLPADAPTNPSANSETERGQEDVPNRKSGWIYEHFERDLVELGIPVDPDGAGLFTATSIGFPLPACLPSNQYDRLSCAAEVAWTSERSIRAVGRGQAAFNRYPIGPNHFDLLRKKDRKIFPRELRLLDELLVEVIKYEDAYQVGWQPKKGLMINLMRTLRYRREQARDSFILEGLGLPPLPIWGYDGNLAELRDENDFEIIGATFRREVESFLFYLQSHHEFRTEDKEDNEDKGKQRATASPERLQSRPPSSLEKFVTSQQPKDHAHFQQDPFPSISGYRAATSEDRVRATIGAGAAMFTNPSTYFSSKRVKELFDDGYEAEDSKGRETPRGDARTQRDNSYGNQPRPRGLPTPGHPNSDPSDGDDDSSDDGGRPNLPRQGPLPPRKPIDPSGPSGSGGGGGPGGGGSSGGFGGGAGGPNGPNPSGGSHSQPTEPQFDLKLKPDAIPEWDGDPETLYHWILKMNALAERSRTVWKQLGQLTPPRLKGSAEKWYYSQSRNTRRRMETNWKTLRTGISNYFMNRSWMEKQKSKANRAMYRDAGNRSETPSEYYIRKFELVSFAYNLNDYEMIREIMNGAPSYWTNILTAHLYTNLEDFQTAIKFHEDNLMKLDSYRRWDYTPPRDFQPRESPRNARVNLVGWSPTMQKPQFPKDDSNVSKRGTPEEKGARPCRHCGSGKHWDPDCKYARKGAHQARTNLVQGTEEDIEAQKEYDDVYYDLPSDDEGNGMDFH